jgi:hypothetical protein
MMTVGGGGDGMFGGQDGGGSFIPGNVEFGNVFDLFGGQSGTVTVESGERRERAGEGRRGRRRRRRGRGKGGREEGGE